MEVGAITLWLEEIDAIYAQIGQATNTQQVLLYNLMRAWVWPLYDLTN